MTADARHADVTHALDWSEHEALRRAAVAVAGQISDIFATKNLSENDSTRPGFVWRSDLAELLRSARDILEQVARG